MLESLTDLQPLQGIANIVRAINIQYPVSYITNRKITRSYRINTLSRNSLLLSLSVWVQRDNALKTVSLPVPLLLAKEALRLALVGLALVGLILCRRPSMQLHLLILLLLVLLPFLKGSRTRR